MDDVVDRLSAAPANPAAPITEAMTDEQLALNVLRRAVEDDPAEGDLPEAAIRTLVNYLGISHFMERDDEAKALDCNEGEMEEALARARLGEFTDCVIHLGRGLPRKFGGIADALEKALGGGVAVKITIERSDLLKAVDPAVKVIQRRNLIPILNNIRIAAEGREITVTATDLEIEIRTTTTADVDSAGAITVPADQLHDLIRRLPDGSQIALELEPDTRLSIRCGRSHTRLPTLPASDYPDIAPGEMTHRFALASELLSALLRDTVFAASNEPTLQQYCGVHLHQVEEEDGSKIATVATDGSRMMARRAARLPEGAEGLPAVTIPTKTVSEIARLVDKDKGEVAIAMCASKLRVVIGQTVLTSNLILGSFPDYRRIVPANVPHEVTVEAAPLLAAIERVSIIADRDNIRSTVFTFDDRKLTLTMANQASGDLREEVACDFEGDSFKVGFDHRYLSKLLGIIGGDTVLMRIGADNSNTMFSTRVGADMFALLAPMKV